jgi:hypothetical protein
MQTGGRLAALRLKCGHIIFTNKTMRLIGVKKGQVETCPDGCGLQGVKQVESRNPWELVFGPPSPRPAKVSSSEGSEKDAACIVGNRSFGIPLISALLMRDLSSTQQATLLAPVDDFFIKGN